MLLTIQVPVADFLNHAAPTHANADAQWHASAAVSGAAGSSGAAAGGMAASGYTVVTRHPVAAGEELLISYGAHDDALLLSQVPRTWPSPSPSPLTTTLGLALALSLSMTLTRDLKPAPPPNPAK